MPFEVPIDQAKQDYPEYTFEAPLTPSAQKAAFKVRNANGEVLCLKIISPDYSVDRLHREIEALQSIDHPNVVHLKEYTFSSRPGVRSHFLVEEFIAGSDLADQLSPGEPWEVARAATLFSQLCDGLAQISAVNVVHRDLKPHNIRVRPDGSPVIIDFGLARHLDLPDLTLTHEGAQIGTPMYFAPEQFDGTKRDIEHRTDLFAVGVLLYETLVGSHPFWQDGFTSRQLRDAVCESTAHLEHRDFKRLPKPWQLLVSRLLHKDRARRPHAASQVAAMIRKLAAE